MSSPTSGTNWSAELQLVRKRIVELRATRQPLFAKLKEGGLSFDELTELFRLDQVIADDNERSVWIIQAWLGDIKADIERDDRILETFLDARGLLEQYRDYSTKAVERWRRERAARPN